MRHRRGLDTFEYKHCVIEYSYKFMVKLSGHGIFDMNIISGHGNLFDIEDNLQVNVTSMVGSYILVRIILLYHEYFYSYNGYPHLCAMVSPQQSMFIYMHHVCPFVSVYC